jgi:hypothetical protein
MMSPHFTSLCPLTSPVEIPLSPYRSLSLSLSLAQPSFLSLVSAPLSSKLPSFPWFLLQSPFFPLVEALDGLRRPSDLL